MASQDATTQSPHLIDEADVGSGEKTPGQRETDAIIEQIGAQRPPAGTPPDAPEPGASGPSAASGGKGAAAPEGMPRAGAT